MKGFMRISFLVVLALLLVPMMAQATMINVGFQRITNNNIENIGSQLGLVIYDPEQSPVTIGGGQVLFAFTNNVGISSNVSEVYIDDGTIVGLFEVKNSIGGFTNFVGSAVTPGNLPGGNTVSPPFVADGLFSADVVSGPPANGINEAADILGIVYNVDSGISGIQDALADGSLRIGLHVRSIGTAGGSDSYINTPSAVSEPGTLMLLGPGLICIGLYRWKRRKG